MPTIEITLQNFEAEVLDARLPVLLDFWAPWCGPCRMVGPVLDEIADAYDGRLVVGKVNVDEQGVLANAFGVRGVPMLALVESGEIAAAMVGAGPRAVVEERLGLARLAQPVATP
ncbi:MAG: thioredoxin domain-containing protein [Thermoleophilia bacterium]